MTCGDGLRDVHDQSYVRRLCRNVVPDPDFKYFSYVAAFSRVGKTAK